MWKYNCPNEGKHEYTRCSFVEPFMKYSHNALSLFLLLYTIFCLALHIHVQSMKSEKNGICPSLFSMLVGLKIACQISPLTLTHTPHTLTHPTHTYTHPTHTYTLSLHHPPIFTLLPALSFLPHGQKASCPAVMFAYIVSSLNCCKNSF